MPRKAKDLPDTWDAGDGSTANGLEHFKRTGPEARFALPARPTVRQQLIYFSRYADTRSDPLYLRLWHSAQTLIAEWECEALPDPSVDLDQVASPDATTAIMWAGNIVMTYMSDLESLP